MLKIAEYNTKTGKKIDLKELEKFGFDVETNTKDELDQLYCFDSGLMFDKDSRNISFPFFDNEKALDTLYDLQEAGYVIKESE